jgi:hypothetical protein
MTDVTPAEALELEIERLPEVRAARVVASPSGRILEIHLVTDGTKAPKQLTRDVETVAATKGIDIDRRTISIAQMPADASSVGIERPGLTLASLTVTTEGAQATCRVRISRADEEAIGEASAPASTTGRPRLVARATVDAVSSLTGSRLPADSDNVRLVDVGEHRVAVVVLVFVSDDGDQTVAPGVQPASGNEDEAVARAVLDAVTRHGV